MGDGGDVREFPRRAAGRTAVWVLLAVAMPSVAAAQPKPPPIVAVGDSVRVYHPTRVEGAVVVAEPLQLTLRTGGVETMTFLSEDLGRFEIYTGWVPRGPRIVEGTLIGLGAGVIPMLTLIGKCTDSCAAKGVTVLGTVGAVLGGLIGGTTAGPQWRIAQLPPAAGAGPLDGAPAPSRGPTTGSPSYEAGFGASGLVPDGTIYVTLGRISF